MHPCTRYNHVHDGRSPYLEITCLYPSLSSISTEWETSDSANIIIRDVHDFTVDNPYFPWYFCAVYCLMVFAMPSLVKEKVRWGGEGALGSVRGGCKALIVPMIERCPMLVWV